jgi:LemA protein
MRKLLWALPLLALLTLSGCGYNDFQTKDEQVKAAWGEVLNQYQRRADLIPNLVATVQGYAAQERDVLIGVTNARAKATSVNVSPEAISDPAAMQKFQQAQAELSGALGRLLVVAENYPQLKSDQNFRELQAQLEGTENRITTARNRFIKAVQDYNILAPVPGQPHRDDVRVQGEGFLHGRGRAISHPPRWFTPKPAAPPSRLPRNPLPRSRGMKASPRFLAALPLAALAATPVPKPPRVTDLAGTLTAPQRMLESKLAAFEKQRGSQVAVLIEPTIGDETIQEFAGRVTDEWQLGRKGVDDGVLFAIAMKERRMRIHTGRGVQGTLTDALSKRIISDIVSPRFRNGDFAGGIDAGVDAIMKAIEGEELPLPKEAPSRGKVGSTSSSGLRDLRALRDPDRRHGVALDFRALLRRDPGFGNHGHRGLAPHRQPRIGIAAAIFAFVFTPGRKRDWQGRGARRQAATYRGGARGGGGAAA